MKRKILGKKKKSATKPSHDFFTALVKSDLKVEIVKEYKFLENRRFRFDYAIPEYKIAVEVEGGIWMKGGGAHSRPQNILRDMEKYTLANIEGWVVIRRTPSDLIKNDTIHLIKKAIQNIDNQRKTILY